MPAPHQLIVRDTDKDRYLCDRDGQIADRDAISLSELFISTTRTIVMSLRRLFQRRIPSSV